MMSEFETVASYASLGMLTLILEWEMRGVEMPMTLMTPRTTTANGDVVHLFQVKNVLFDPSCWKSFTDVICFLGLN
jgi:hypothetical protein